VRRIRRAEAKPLKARQSQHGPEFARRQGEILNLEDTKRLDLPAVSVQEAGEVVTRVSWMVKHRVVPENAISAQDVCPCLADHHAGAAAVRKCSDHGRVTYHSVPLSKWEKIWVRTSRGSSFTGSRCASTILSETAILFKII
jgi:hypothetical protein